MKITEKEINGFVKILCAADEFMPMIELTLQKSELALSKLGPMIRSFSKFTVENTIDMIGAYEKAGFTREEAILLVMSTKVAVSEAMNRMNTQNK